ncbi:MAG: hypothetical protein JXA30_18900 [Deltaproteobacteria bacterium]|nr:hypothetical protein [Deltaproteobacteria bacterium]
MRTSNECLSRLPPLASLAAVAALCSLLTNRLLVPAFGDRTDHEFVFDLIRSGHFFANLTAVTGLFALTTAIFSLVRGPEHASIWRRLGVACLAGIFLPTVALATFFPREHTTIHIVLFGIGAANTLIVIIAMNGARSAVSPLGKILAIALATMALFALAAQVYQLISSHRLYPHHMRIASAFRGVGEFAYVLSLLAAALFAFPRTSSLRDQFARIASVVVFGASVFGFHLTQLALEADFTLLLYHAQRVSVLIDSFPFAYAFPIGLGLAAAVGAIISGNSIRTQAAIGILLLISAGYAPYSPERLLTQTLATMLFARAIIALAKGSATDLMYRTEKAGTE